MGLDDILGFNDILNNTNVSIWEVFPPELVSQIGSLITILKITGIVVIGYIIFLLIRWIFSIRRHRKINKIYKKVYEIDRKLDVLVSRRKLEKKEKKPEVKEKEGLIKRLFKRKSLKSKKKKK